jgi:hypothetical protein
LSKSVVKIMFAEPLMIPTSSVISQMVKQWSSMINVHTLSLTLNFGSLAISRYNGHCPPPKVCWILLIVSAWVSQIFWQNSLLLRSVISSETRMQLTCVTPLHYLAVTDASGGVAR